MIPSILISTIVGTVVGLKLLILASRTRHFPELAIGGALFCYAAIAQTSSFATHAVGLEASHSVRMTLLALRLAAFYLTMIGLATFTWRVFDASSSIRKTLTIVLAITAAITVSASFWAAWNELTYNGGLPLYARLGASPQYVVVFAWMSIESLRYQRLMRKREVLGLADPVVTNRFGIWGLSAAASCVLTFALTIVMIRSNNMFLGADPVSSAIISATGLVNTLGWWLTFMPPAVYTNWVKARSERSSQNSSSAAVGTDVG